MRLPLSAVEVRKLWGATAGKDYLMWRVMILTGARIGEALALDRADLVSEGLRIDESALNGQANYTKNKKNPDCPDSGITTRRGGGVARNPQSPADVSHERWRDAAATMGSWKQW